MKNLQQLAGSAIDFALFVGSLAAIAGGLDEGEADDPG
jgi:hypothetical protein